MRDVVAIVPAAGLGERMGADKALLGLGERTVVERVVATLRTAGVGDVLVVRRRGADPLPDGLAATVVEVEPGGEMADSLRAAHARLPAGAGRILVLPVDHALVEADTVRAVVAGLDDASDAHVALPTYRDRPGHPVAFERAVFDEITADGAVLRDLVRRDPDRVRTIPTANPWVRADLDHPEDLRAARAALAQASPLSTVELMARHRSRRSFRDAPVPREQIERLVDAARHASTSSYIQTTTVIAVTEPQKRAECARLCGGQQQIVEAPVFFALCADLQRLARACEQHGATLQSQSLELFLQATVDAALVGQNLLLAAESEGLGGCMIGGARNHPIELAELLGLPAHAYVVFGMTVGEPIDDPAARGRMPLTGVLHFEGYDHDGVDAALAGADEVMNDWARRANAQSAGYGGRPVDETKGWAARMARMWGEDGRYAIARRTLMAELRRLGFGLADESAETGDG